MVAAQVTRCHYSCQGEEIGDVPFAAGVIHDLQSGGFTNQGSHERGAVHFAERGSCLNFHNLGLIDRLLDCWCRDRCTAGSTWAVLAALPGESGDEDVNYCFVSQPPVLVTRE